MNDIFGRQVTGVYGMARRFRCKVPAGSFCASKRAKIRAMQRDFLASKRVFLYPVNQLVRGDVLRAKKAAEALL